jgi:hypothetical protein
VPEAKDPNLGLFELHLATAEKVSDRRAQANAWMLSVNSAIVALYGYLQADKTAVGTGQKAICSLQSREVTAAPRAAARVQRRAFPFVCLVFRNAGVAQFSAVFERAVSSPEDLRVCPCAFSSFTDRSPALRSAPTGSRTLGVLARCYSWSHVTSAPRRSTRRTCICSPGQAVQRASERPLGGRVG